jgi:hypothetical protein
VTLAEGITSDIERLSGTVADLKTAASEPGFNQVPALAQFLSQFYTGLESCLEKKLKLAGIEVPAKDDRHPKTLLLRAIESKLIPSSCTDAIVDLLGFRHFARHGYGAEFRADEVRQKAAHVEKVWSEMKSFWEDPKSEENSGEQA